ncbi:MAG TPA: DUF6178 family protein [Vicinamibacterales bacterium]
MSRTTDRGSSFRDGGTVDLRLAWLLETPSLARVVPHLPAETLHQLVRHRGLDACAELVASATPAQLTRLLDLDLWRPAQAGDDDLFDTDRFSEWLEVLVDTGSSVAARIIASLDTDLVVAGLSRCIRVLDPGIFEPTAQSDDELPDRFESMREGDALHPDGVIEDDAGAEAPECELGGYVIRARRANAWDALVTLLLTLEAEHEDAFHALMRGCRRLSNSNPEIDGLDDLLLAPEQHLHDVTLEREERRSQQGYATAADARAFLQMARQRPETRSGAFASVDANPIAAAYFRAIDEAREDTGGSARLSRGELPASPSPEQSSRLTDAPATGLDVPGELASVVELLTEAGMMPAVPRARLEAGTPQPDAAPLARLRRLLAHAHDIDEAAYLARTRELAFLANTLLAGCSLRSRPFTPQEASDAAASTCNLGLEYWPARWPRAASRATTPAHQDASASLPDSFLVDHDLVKAFEVGWSVLHQDVSLFAAEQLIGVLARLHVTDDDARHEVAALRRALVREHEAGTPWRVREAAEILAMLDAPAWLGVLGLLDECPNISAALTAVLEGRTTSVSPSEFAFVSTPAQIADVDAFLRKLPELLAT